MCIRDRYYVDSVIPSEANKLASYDSKNKIVNVRCRNFGIDDLKHSGVFSSKDLRGLFFTREPSSFIVSATRYHLKGKERLNHLYNGQYLTDVLRGCSTESEAYVVTMKHFKKLYSKQVSLQGLFSDKRFMRVKVEELFTTEDPAYFESIARFLRLGENKEYIEALKAASPVMQNKLIDHSTGTFKLEDPLSLFDSKARDYFEDHYLAHRDTLVY